MIVDRDSFCSNCEAKYKTKIAELRLVCDEQKKDLKGNEYTIDSLNKKIAELEATMQKVAQDLDTWFYRGRNPPDDYTTIVVSIKRLRREEISKELEETINLIQGEE